MRKITCLIISILICTSFSACNGQKSTELSEKDHKYIDSVYNSMSKWDITQADGSEHYSVGKIAFQDLDGTNKLCFYVLYPITDIYGWGYYVKDDGIERIKISINDADLSAQNNGCLIQTNLDGTSWNSSASNEKKYETIEKAYKAYLQSE